MIKRTKSRLKRSIKRLLNRSEKIPYVRVFPMFPMNHVGKKTVSVCNSIRTTTTFTMEACGETFKTRSGTLNCNSEKLLYLLKCKVFSEASYVGKAKTKF